MEAGKATQDGDDCGEQQPQLPEATLPPLLVPHAVVHACAQGVSGRRVHPRDELVREVDVVRRVRREHPFSTRRVELRGVERKRGGGRVHAPTVVRRVMEGALRVDLEACAVRLRRYTCDAPRPREVSGDERAASREWSGHPPVFEESARRTVGIDGTRTICVHGAEEVDPCHLLRNCGRRGPRCRAIEFLASLTRLLTRFGELLTRLPE